MKPVNSLSNLRVVRLLGAAVAAAALAVPLAAPDALAVTGTISGSVSGPSDLTDVRVRFVGTDGSKPAAVTVADNGSWSIPWTASECGWVEAFSLSGYWSTERPSQYFCSGDVVPPLSMVAAGAVSGTVTTGVGASPATSVVALTSDWQVAYRGTVAGDGTYRLGGLRPGSYRIAFDHSNPNHEGPDATWVTTNQVRYWRSGYLTGVPETQWSTATLRTVTANTDSSGTNAQVQAGGSVNGALTCRNGGAAVDGTSTYGISLVTGSEPYIDRFTHVDAGLGWASSGHSTGVDYIFMVYGCEMPIFLGNTLNPWKADYVPGAESGLDVGGLDLRTALLFKDVSAFTAFAADMQWLVLRGIATGYSDDTFRPVTSVRRDAMAAFLYRMAGEPAYTPPSVSPFADVTPSTQFYKEMSWLYSTGISTGWVSGGKRYYKPGLAVARDAMAAFIYRFAGSPTYSETFHFDDVTDQTLFHKEMDWMFDAGISTGWVENGQTLYKPLNSVNRDAMAAFLHRLDKWTAAAGAAPAAASAKSGSAPSLLSQSVGDAGSRSGNAGSGLLDPSILAHLKSMR